MKGNTIKVQNQHSLKSYQLGHMIKLSKTEFFLILKIIYSEKVTKFCEIFTFDYSTYSQKIGEDFAKFCGLLRIYEL